MQRRLSSVAAAAGSLTIVVLGMAVMNARVREQLRHLLDGPRPSPDTLSTAYRMQDAAMVALDAMRDQTIEHAPLTIFALAATVLLLFMLRT